MKIILHERNGNVIAELDEEGLVIREAQDFLEIAANSPSRNIVVHKENIIPAFFDLKTRIAGEVLQKASNYRIRIGIVGNFKNVASKSLQDFIYESNLHEEVLFKESVEEVLEIFGRD